VDFKDLTKTPYPLSRMSMIGRRGAVTTSQPLAAQAGMSILQQGGNAVDAAIATAMALTVVEPTMNGIGSDAFALVWAEGKLHGLNASGRSPALATHEEYLSRGLEKVPDLGWLSVTVPGAVSAWFALHERFGRLSFPTVAEPAIALAEGGYCVSPVVANSWRLAAEQYQREAIGPEFAGWFQTFGAQGTSAGDIVKLADHATTLRDIAATNGASFYEGRLAEALDSFSQATGGLIRGDDMAAHRPQWVEPISTSYRGFDVWEIPPNGHGVAALSALNILEGFAFDENSFQDPHTWHLQIEAMKLAFADTQAYVADPEHVDVPTQGMLDKDYAATRRSLIKDEASEPFAGHPPRGGTVLLCTADGEGQMVSFIQSNYLGFGSAVVIPGTGIALQNRGANFSLTTGHPNVIAPRKRPYHTIIPGFLTKSNEAVGPFGVMGGFMQPQGHVQVIMRTVDQQLHPQGVLDAPRWRWEHGRTVWVEPRTPESVVADLTARGHEIKVVGIPSAFGRGQIIWRLKEGLIAGSESRADGQALVW
jgi:gamma-glutamyltranspeptidase / glutathione hydrolase